jgi:5-methylcytosine-specific restriction endonuclease McrA
MLEHYSDPLVRVLSQRWQRLAFRHLLRSIDPHCLYCGRYLQPKRATLDHLLPVSRGGGHDVNNLALACSLCNLAKGERTPQEWLEDLKRACERLESGDRHGTV